MCPYWHIQGCTSQGCALSEQIVATSKIFQKGKTQVPSQVRRELDLKDGDVIVWIKTTEGYVVERGKRKPLFRETRK
jgi:bifunctional DNA-binding transcriptional regulator/antitoxin component of YhaV-PrlF toxin-antitoxin module